MDALVGDLRDAVRHWLRAPLVTTIALLSLALGIGATTAIYALADAVYMRTLPVENATDLVQLSNRRASDVGPSDSVYDAVVWDQIRTTQTIFAAVAATASERVTVANGGESRFAHALFVNGTFFDMFGVPMAMGRRLTVSDDAPGAPKVAVVDYAFWRHELNGRPTVIGATVAVEGRTAEIVGVTAPAFFGIEVGRRTQIYMTLASSPTSGAGDGHVSSNVSLRIFARLRRNQSLDGAAAAVRAWQPALRETILIPGSSAVDQLVEPLDIVSAAQGVSPLRHDVEAPLLLLLGGVGLVLAIACANFAALMSARFADRRSDLWMRRALGASTNDLVRGMVVETLLISGAGAMIGIALALWLARFLVPALMQSSLQDVEPFLSIGLDWRLLAAATSLALFTGIVTGLPPAIFASRATRVLRPSEIERARPQAVASRRTMLGLVTTQVALSLVLVSTAGTLIRSFLALTLQPLGVDRDRVLLASLNGLEFDQTPATTTARLVRLSEAFERIPGIQAVSVSTVTPMSGLIVLTRLHVPGYVSRDRTDDAVAINRVTPKFFEVFGTPVLSGRGFDQRDAAGRPLVAIVNQAFERQYFTHGAAVGHVIKIGSRNLEIVGVAAVAKYMQLREGTRPVVYAPLAQAITADPQPLRFAFRIDAAPNSSRAVILTALQQFDPRLTVEFRTLSDEIAYSVRREQTLAWSGTLVGLLALSMAALGLYGVFSHFVNRRRTEIAIRIALGADRYAIWNLVLRTALVTVVVGSVLGAGAVIASARWIDSVAFDTRAFDPWTLAATLGVIVAVASAATFMPVRRAGRIDPLRYLRSH